MQKLWALSLAALLGLGGCASDRYLMSEGHQAFRNSEYEKAAALFAKDAAQPSANQLLFLLDEGSSLFAAGRYKEATDVFLKAEKLSEIKDYTSISEEVGTLATGDNIRGYKGEDFEKVLINVYLGLSYASLGMIEDAQVEARKINQLLYRMIHEGKRNYQESPFARYLSALLWEATGNTNDAYLDYKKTYELDPRFPDIGRDLISGARKMRFGEDLIEWRKKFPGEEGRELPKGDGELIVVFERGWGPVKIPRDGQNSTLPRFVTRYSDESGAQVKVNGEVRGQTVGVLDIEALSIKYLEDRINRMAAAKLIGVAAKGAIAAGVGKLTNNEDLGWLTFYALALTDHADLRCWRSLPAELQMVRIPLKPGTYRVDVEALGHSNQVLRDRPFEKVLIKAGRKTFLTAR